VAAVIAVHVLAPAAVRAQSNPRYIQFSPGAVKGALYRPDSGPTPHIGILIIHRTSNFMAYQGCVELARRGFAALCMNPRSDNNEARVRWEDNALDVKSGVRFLRELPGIQFVILWGFSGGGPTTTFYQAVAEKGPSYCRGPNKLISCRDDLAALPAADALILVDSHPGNAANALRRLNGAVTNDADILGHNARPRIDPALDPFSPANGYNPAGPSRYSEEFRRRYFSAQAARMTRLIDLAAARLRSIENGSYSYPDDDAFIVPMGDGAELMLMDPRIHHSTAKPQKLLKNDGTIARQIVESVRPPQPRLAAQNRSFLEGTLFLTLRSFLSANAIRATDSMDNIDVCSTNNSVPCALRVISVPLLITAMGANNYIRFNEIHHDIAHSADKDFVVVEGATHGQTPCVPCESVPGQYSNVVKNFFDYVQTWANQRFGLPGN
jgi:hypothetical protein